MRILLLATNPPSLRHAKAVETVAAVLIRAWRELGHEVVWATAGSKEPPDPASQEILLASGATYLGDFSDELVSQPGGQFAAWSAMAANAMGLGADFPRFRHPDHLAARLCKDSGADAAVLFWDTWFEHLMPHLGMPSVAYWARPRYASPLDALESGGAGPANPLARKLVLRGLRHARNRHFQRAASVSQLTNICAVDAAMYRDRGLPCTYVSNTWPDPVGGSWRDRRQAAEAHAPFSILAAMGSLTAAGTTQGMRFWASEVLPFLDQRMDGDWSIAVCGRNAEALPPDLRALLAHPRVTVKGFVPDIDEEMLASRVFLMCNNAGTYSGGYTRVIYAMATGGCMIAHRRLAESMPEVRHGENALLGETGAEIAALVEQAWRDDTLRRRIGEAARRTYENEYHPHAVARKLADLAAIAR